MSNFPHLRRLIFSLFFSLKLFFSYRSKSPYLSSEFLVYIDMKWLFKNIPSFHLCIWIVGTLGLPISSQRISYSQIVYKKVVGSSIKKIFFPLRASSNTQITMVVSLTIVLVAGNCRWDILLSFLHKSTASHLSRHSNCIWENYHMIFTELVTHSSTYAADRLFFKFSTVQRTQTVIWMKKSLSICI